ncbi:hypothetical protein BDV3_003933 [Batrachochytrium dendrobatidis]|uniref:Protein kinase domain-containing protein n=1 Tax=Batrachochytrium dendrobatidis (strain JEL423) TaxID=403673 RepID=A0A177WEA7_BATDL|nr:hypothetical protein BDEG_22315 [Batrachochytrium dendrobatidis JEL423]
MAASQNEHEISYPRFSTTDDLIYALMDLYSDIQQLSYNLHINQAQSARLLARLSLVNQELAACEHDLVRPSSKLEHALYRLLSFLQQVKAFYTRYSDSLWFHTVMHCTNDRLEFLRLTLLLEESTAYLGLPFSTIESLSMTPMDSNAAMQDILGIQRRATDIHSTYTQSLTSSFNPDNTDNQHKEQPALNNTNNSIELEAFMSQIKLEVNHLKLEVRQHARISQNLLIAPAIQTNHDGDAVALGKGRHGTTFLAIYSESAKILRIVGSTDPAPLKSALLERQKSISKGNTLKNNLRLSMDPIRSSIDNAFDEITRLSIDESDISLQNGISKPNIDKTQLGYTPAALDVPYDTLLMHSKHVAVKKLDVSWCSDLEYDLVRIIDKYHLTNPAVAALFVPYLGLVKDELSLFVVSEYMPNGSLTDLFHRIKNKGSANRLGGLANDARNAAERTPESLKTSKSSATPVSKPSTSIPLSPIKESISGVNHSSSQCVPLLTLKSAIVNPLIVHTPESPPSSIPIPATITPESLTKIDSPSTLTLNQKYMLVRRLAEAMKTLHESNLLHRDLCSSNVYPVDGLTNVKLGDVGLSDCVKRQPCPEKDTKAITSGFIKLDYSVPVQPSSSKDMAGARYISPELIGIGDRELCTRQSDVYAFGVIVYEILIGGEAYSGNLNANQIYERTLAGKRPRFETGNYKHQRNSSGLSARAYAEGNANSGKYSKHHSALPHAHEHYRKSSNHNHMSNSGIPLIWRNLVSCCWAQHPSARPLFPSIVDSLVHDEAAYFSDLEPTTITTVSDRNCKPSSIAHPPPLPDNAALSSSNDTQPSVTKSSHKKNKRESAFPFMIRSTSSPSYVRSPNLYSAPSSTGFPEPDDLAILGEGTLDTSQKGKHQKSSEKDVDGKQNRSPWLSWLFSTKSKQASADGMIAEPLHQPLSTPSILKKITDDDDLPLTLLRKKRSQSVDMTQTGNAHAATAAEILESGRLRMDNDTYMVKKLEATATPTSAKQVYLNLDIKRVTGLLSRSTASKKSDNHFPVDQKTLDIPTNVPAAPAQHLAQEVLKSNQPSFSKNSTPNVLATNGKHTQMVFMSSKSGRLLQIWDITSGAYVMKFKISAWAICLAAKGRCIVTVPFDSDVPRVWDRKAKSNHNSSTHVSPVGNTSAGADFAISSPHFQHGLYGHTQRVCCIAGAADRPVVITGSWDWTARVWFLDTFNNDHSKHAHGHRKNSSLSQSGHAAPEFSTLSLKRSDSRYTVTVLKGHAGSVLAVALTPDGKIAITGGWDRLVRIWDTASGRCRQIVSGHTSWVTCLSLSKNSFGITVASGSLDGSVRVWKMGSKGLDAQLAHVFTPDMEYSQPFALQHAPTTTRSDESDAFVANGSSKSDTNRSTQPAIIDRESAWIHSVAISANGSTLISGSQDASVRIWDMKQGVQVRKLTGHLSPISYVAISSDGQMAISGGGVYENIKVWDIKSGECLQHIPGRVMSPQSLILVEGDVACGASF